jgi:hypothetical protein
MLVGVAVWALQASNLRPPPCKRQNNHSRLTHETATVVQLGLYDTHAHRCDWYGAEFLGQFLGTSRHPPVCFTSALTRRRLTRDGSRSSERVTTAGTAGRKDLVEDSRFSRPRVMSLDNAGLVEEAGTPGAKDWQPCLRQG